MTQHKFEIDYEEFESTDSLSEDEKKLVDLAWLARQNAYAPYSNFKVGAAVLTKDGQTFQGSNRENVNFKVSCAERVVLDSMGAAGCKDKLAKIAVVAESEEPIMPCGQCRQDIKEVEDLSNEPIVIISASRSKVRRIIGIQKLLPFALGPKLLK